jgi:hypothetical protein
MGKNSTHQNFKIQSFLAAEVALGSREFCFWGITPNQKLESYKK